MLHLTRDSGAVDAPAGRTAYLSWGWQRFGRLQPFDDAPVYDSLMYTLSPESG